MGTNERLLWRELGCRQPTAGRASRPLNGNGPVAFERSFNSDEGLIKRLSQTAELTGDAASVSNLSWSPDGQFLASGGEDCRITVWEPGMHQKKHTIDMVGLPCLCPSFLHSCSAQHLEALIELSCALISLSC